MNEQEYAQVRQELLEEFHADPAAYVRVTEDVARVLLLRNENFIIQGTVRWLRIIPLGLGVYNITLNTNGKTTCMG